MRIHELIVEIKHLSKPSRKSAYEIFRLLDNNKLIFQPALETDYLETIINSFEDLSNSHPSVYDTPAFTRDFEQHFQSLLYKLDKII